MGLLRFAVLSIDLLAWPAIALGYPLFASIRAVESGSMYHMKKLVIYWTLFSLFSLFEFAFVKIIVWIPFWSSVRFVVIFWLVMPQFDGSNRAYQGLVRPILVMKLQEVIYMIQKLKEERFCKRETFLDLVEKYIKENGPEAMEKLIALEHENRKRIKALRETESEVLRRLNETQAARRDPEMLEATERSAAATTTHQLPYAQSTASVNQTDVVTFVKDTTPPEASADNRRPKSPLMDTQQEFTCELCKVTAMSEIILNDHLQGRKHKSKLESLKASMLCAKDTKPSPLYENQKCIKTPRETESEGKRATAASKHVNESPAARHDTEMLEAAEKSVAATETLQEPHAQSSSFVNRTVAITNVRQTTPPEESAENKRPKTPSLVETLQEWTCALCKVTTTSEIILNAHLQGRKHKSKLESLNASMLCENDTGPSPLHEKQKCIKSPRETESEGENSAATLKQLSDPQAARRDTEMLETTDVPDAQSTSSVNQTDAVTNAQETTPPEASADRRPKTPSLVEPQQEWTCGLCKVTATNEIILNAHLQGKKHKSKLKSLEASLLGAKDTGSSPLVQHKQSVSAVEVKEFMPQKETAEEIYREMPPVKKAQQEWTDLCEVTTTSEITLNGHLHGSKHKSKLQTLEASKLGATFAGPSDSPSSKMNHGNMSEKFIKDSGSEWEMIMTSKIEATPSESSSGHGHAGTPPLNQAKQEWSCDLCCVKTTGEKTLNDHFKGSKHKAKLQSLNTCIVNEDGEGIVKEVEISKYWCIACNLKLLSDVDLAYHLVGKRHSSNIEALIS